MIWFSFLFSLFDCSLVFPLFFVSVLFV